MTIQYKNQGFKQASTGKTTVFTCPSDATVIVKSVYCSNSDASSAPSKSRSSGGYGGGRDRGRGDRF